MLRPPRLALDPRQVKEVAARAEVGQETVRNWLKGVYVRPANRNAIASAADALGYHVGAPSPAVAPPESLPLVAIPSGDTRRAAEWSKLLARECAQRDGRPAGGVQT